MVKSCRHTDKTCLKKGSWSPEEDQKLMDYINRYGIWNWAEMPKAAGLLRRGKSCRLRWMNYLRPGIKHGNFSEEEDETIIKLHQQLGNRWSTIASRLPGRTDNEIKNHWHTSLKKYMKNNLQVPKPNLKETQGEINVKQRNLYEVDDLLLFINPPKDSNCNIGTIPSMPSQPSFDNVSPSSIDPDGEIYNTGNIDENNNGSLGSTCQELQSLRDPASPYPMEGLYTADDYHEVINTDPGCLVSTPQLWGFQENTYTSASYDDDGDGLLAYLSMEANEGSLINSFFY